MWIGDEDGCLIGICIYFLFKNGESSYWYIVDVVEIWYYYVGVLIVLFLLEIDLGLVVDYVFGFDVLNGQLL